MDSVREISKAVRGLPVKKQHDVDQVLEALRAKGASSRVCFIRVN